MTMDHSPAPHCVTAQSMRAFRQERGIVLFVALIALVILSLAGISLFRTIDASGLISGNLAFRQAALSATDIGVERAIAYLSSLSEGQRWNGVAPDPDDPEENPAVAVAGYWPTRQLTFDPFSAASWQAANPVTVTVAQGAPDNGDVIQFVIHRLCDNPGNPADAAAAPGCSRAPATAGGALGGEGSSRKIFGYGEGTPDPAVTNSPYYRITTRVSGARNSVAYTQVLVFFQ